MENIIFTILFLWVLCFMNVCRYLNRKTSRYFLMYKLNNVLLLMRVVIYFDKHIIIMQIIM